MDKTIGLMVCCSPTLTHGSQGLRSLWALGRAQQTRPTPAQTPECVPDSVFPRTHQPPESHTSPLHGVHSHNGNRHLQPTGQYSSEPKVGWGRSAQSSYLADAGVSDTSVAIYLLDGLGSSQPIGLSRTKADSLLFSEDLFRLTDCVSLKQESLTSEHLIQTVAATSPATVN